MANFEFRVGMPVICLQDSRPGGAGGYKKGQIYIVEDITANHLQTTSDSTGTPNGWYIDYFRPLLDLSQVEKVFYGIHE